MDLLSIFLIFFALCLSGAVICAVLPQKATPFAVALFGSLASVCLLFVGASVLITGHGPSIVLWHIKSLGDLHFAIDRLSGLFMAVTAIVALPVSIHAIGQLKKAYRGYNLRAYGMMYMLLVAALAAVVAAQDVVTFLITWEIMSILIYFLVNLNDHGQEELVSGYQMLAISEAGTICAAIGLLVLAVHAHSMDFSVIQATSKGLLLPAIWCVFLTSFFGFGVKAGLFPVNFWLPGAYTTAPAAFTPLLAGATLNMGIYGIVRVDTMLMPTSHMMIPGLVVLVIGTITAITGILYATTENDLKTMLAHSSIENAGIIMSGIGAGMVFTATGHGAIAAIAFVAGLYHMVNHSTYKALLFTGAGAIEAETGVRNLDLLGGLLKYMPLTGAAFLIGCLSISAMPPFNGFVSEWLTLQTMLMSAGLSVTWVKVIFALCGATLALTAALAVTCFVKAFAMGFLGMPRSEMAHRSHKAAGSSRFAMIILAIGCLVLGVLPTYVIPVLGNTVAPVCHSSAATALVPPFFAHSAAHGELPADFVKAFQALGAQVGQSFLPGRGLVVMHRGGPKNPVVFAMSTSYTLVVLLLLLGVTFICVTVFAGIRRRVERKIRWDGGIKELVPEMTYTATGFSNPMRVIFNGIFRPASVEDAGETIAGHFRLTIKRERTEVHLVDRLVVRPASKMARGFARVVAFMHNGKVNAYASYGLIVLVAGLILVMWL